MFNQVINRWLVGFGSLCLLFLFLNQMYGTPLRSEIQLVLVPTTSNTASTIPSPNTTDFIQVVPESSSSWNAIQLIIDVQRRLIENYMIDYNYPNGKYNRNAKKLDDLVMEKNGTPIRSIILSTWRSGSTFFGDVLNAQPANFYHYEPLLDLDIIQIRGPPLASRAIDILRALLNCDYSDLGHYINYSKKQPWVFNQNADLWRQCETHSGICLDPKFLSAMCKLYPFQSMKIVRLRLRIAQELLSDQRLAVRLILLIRDPRGVFQSRKQAPFCPLNPDCFDPALLCADMVSDYKIAVELLKKYPDRFRVIRFEDLAADLYKNVEELYQFYGLHFGKSVIKFLDTHSKYNGGDLWSTYRNSKAIPFHWKNELKFEEVDEVQQSCTRAMKQWGYVPAINATHQRNFNPITNYTLNF